MLESHYFHHAMWNFATNLFDRSVMRCIALEEDMEMTEEQDPEGEIEAAGGDEYRLSGEWLQ